MKWVYSTGGREKYFKQETVRDCVVRAICNATNKDYKEVYDRIQYLEKHLKVGKHERQGSARNGVRGKVYKYYIEKELGWIHHSTMKYQQGVSMHLTEEEIPEGVLIVDISKHLTCVKNKIIYDTYDCSTNQYYDRTTNELIINNKRAIYNYWTAPTEEDLEHKRYIEKLIEKENMSIKETKQKIDSIKDKYKPILDKLEKQLKEIQHKLKIETNRMNKEISKIKKENGNKFCNSVLESV